MCQITLQQTLLEQISVWEMVAKVRLVFYTWNQFYADFFYYD